MTGALDFSDKEVNKIMTSYDKVYKLEVRAHLVLVVLSSASQTILRAAA